MNKERLCR